MLSTKAWVSSPEPAAAPTERSAKRESRKFAATPGADFPIVAAIAEATRL